LCDEEMRRVGAYLVQVKLYCPLGLLSQCEEMAIAELFVAEDMAIADILSHYEELAVAELLVDQEEWQVHGPQVMRSVFDLTVYAASVGISGHLRKFHAGTTI
jgi:hypothetical protein